MNNIQLTEEEEEKTPKLKEFGVVVEESQAKGGLKEFGEIVEEPRESTGVEMALRPVGVAARSGISSAVGTFGDLQELAGGLTGNLLDRLTGINTSQQMQERGLDKLGRAPTSQEVKDVIDRATQKAFGTDFKPQNKTEEYVDRVADFVGSAASTGGLTGGASIGRKVAQVVAPAIANKFLEDSGAPAWVQATGTIGTGLLASLKYTGVKDIKNQMYKTSKELSKDQKVSASEFGKNLKALRSELSVGTTTPEKTAARKQIKELLGKIKKGKIGVNELVEAKQDLGSVKSQAFQQTGFSKTAKSDAIWKRLYGTMNKGIEEFEKISPKFKEAYRQADSINKGMHETRKMVNWIKKNPKLS